MFSIHDFVKSGFLKAVGKQPDYWIQLNSAGWLDKGVLTKSDLEEIDKAIKTQNQTVTEIPATGPAEVEETDNDNGEPDT